MMNAKKIKLCGLQILQPLFSNLDCFNLYKEGCPSIHKQGIWLDHTAKNSEYYNGKILTLKNDLQKLLKVVCDEQRNINGKKEKNVFHGYKLILSMEEEDNLDP